MLWLDVTSKTYEFLVSKKSLTQDSSSLQAGQ